MLQYPARWIRRICTGATGVLLAAPVALRAQQGQHVQLQQDHDDDPRTARTIAVLGVSTLPDDQRAIVYIRPHQRPSIAVVVRDGGGTAADLAAGYETALRMVKSDVVQHPKPGQESAQLRAVIGRSDVRALSPEQNAAYSRSLDHLAHSPHMQVSGIGDGKLLHIKRRG
jgi:hypothetical protein